MAIALKLDKLPKNRNLLSQVDYQRHYGCRVERRSRNESWTLQLCLSKQT